MYGPEATKTNQEMQAHFKKCRCAQSGKDSMCPVAAGLYGKFLGEMYAYLDKRKAEREAH